MKSQLREQLVCSVPVDCRARAAALREAFESLRWNSRFQIGARQQSILSIVNLQTSNEPNSTAIFQTACTRTLQNERLNGNSNANPIATCSKQRARAARNAFESVAFALAADGAARDFVPAALAAAHVEAHQHRLVQRFRCAADHALVELLLLDLHAMPKRKRISNTQDCEKQAYRDCSILAVVIFHCDKR